MSKIFNESLSISTAIAILMTLIMGALILTYAIGAIIQIHNASADDSPPYPSVSIFLCGVMAMIATYILLLGITNFFNYTKNWIPPRDPNPASVYHDSQKRKFRV